MRKLEAVFAVLIATMALSFAWMFGDTKPSGKQLLIGNAILFCWILNGLLILSVIIVDWSHRFS